MKNLFKICILSFGILSFTSVAKAQVVTMTNPNGAVIDTATQAAVEGPVAIVNSYQSTVSMVIPVTKISGVIAGTINWQGSNDGINYWTIATSTLTDATNVYGWSETPKRNKYYRAQVNQTGTSSLSYKATIYYTQQ